MVKLDQRVPVIPTPETTVMDLVVPKVEETVPEHQQQTEPGHESEPPDSENETDETISTPKRVLRVS